MSGVMTGEYIGVLPDHIVNDRANKGGLVPIKTQIINGKNTLLNPVLKHIIRELIIAADLKKTA